LPLHFSTANIDSLTTRLVRLSPYWSDLSVQLSEPALPVRYLTIVLPC
jgi:hypothetical protein